MKQRLMNYAVKLFKQLFTGIWNRFIICTFWTVAKIWIEEKNNVVLSL